MRVTHRPLAVVAVLLMTTACLSAQSEPTSNRTVLDGVYTDAQAIRGETAYGQFCSHCHAADMGGSGAAPTLYTLQFLDRWREDTLGSLFQYIHEAMPLAPGPGPGGLTENQYLDILTYILWRNEFPEGAKELAAADLDTTLLVGPGGPKPLPPDATVRVAGCLANASGNWIIQRATNPSRTRDGTRTNASELARSTASAPGTYSFRLPNLSDDFKEAELVANANRRVQVKGVLNGQGTSARIFVLSLEFLNQPCEG